MASSLDAVLDDALADFGTHSDAQTSAHVWTSASRDRTSISNDRAGPEQDAQPSGSQSSASTNASSTDPSPPLGFNPLGNKARGRRKAHGASRPATSTGQTSDPDPGSSSHERQPRPHQFGAVPPDLADLPADVTQRLSQLMGELAAVDVEGRANASGQAGAPQPEPEVSATLRQLAEQSRLHAGSAAGDPAAPLDESMLERLGAELGGLGGLGALGNLGGGEGGLGSLAETIMHQLLSKDILYTPMKEIGARYPSWLQAHQHDVPEAELQRYRDQYSYIQQICKLYEDNPSDSAKLFELVQAMQACGNPPQDIVDEMSPGLSFDNDGLPSFPEGHQDADLPKCSIQ